MRKEKLFIYSRVFVLFFLAVFLSYTFASLTTASLEGDSVAYHIPIAKSVLTGYIFSPQFYLGFYPSNAEIFLAVLLFFHIPLNAFNVIGILLLFFVLKSLGERFGLEKAYAVIFAITVCLLPTMLRWFAAQVIDIWLLVFYCLGLVFLQKPEKNARYFLLLGLAIGLLIGVKYSGPLLAFGLIFVYGPELRSSITPKRFFLLCVPIFILGFSWYIRNILLVHNPIYPQALFSLPGMKGWNIFAYHEWQIIAKYPGKTLNAFVSEYLGWFFAPVVSLASFILFRKVAGKDKDNFYRLCFLSIWNFCLFLFLPTSPEYNIIVSSIRYSYPAFILAILAVFLIAKVKKHEEVVIIVSFSGLFFLPSLSYHPKLLFIYLILVSGVWFIKKGFSKKAVMKE